MKCWLSLLGATGCLSLLGATGCVASALEERPTNNPEITVQVIATHDGCTIYRFRDGHWHWFVRCRGEPSTVAMTQTPCGKGCLRDETIAAQSPEPALPARPEPSP
jgi:hypothetical protein